MARIGSSSLMFPPFRGLTRRLVLINLVVFFVLLVLGAVNRSLSDLIFGLLVLTPRAVTHGYVWQLVTYAFVHRGILEALFNLLSLWFIASYIEQVKGSRWLTEIYFLAVVGGALIATALSFTPIPRLSPLDYASGAQAGIFGLLAAFAVLFGEQQFFLFPLPIGIKAKYLVLIYLLIAIASLFGGGSILPLVVYLAGGLLGFSTQDRRAGRGLSLPRANEPMAFVTSTTVGSGAGRRASLRSTCESITGTCTSTMRGDMSIRTKGRTPTTASG